MRPITWLVAGWIPVMLRSTANPRFTKESCCAEATSFDLSSTTLRKCVLEMRTCQENSRPADPAIEEAQRFAIFAGRPSCCLGHIETWPKEISHSFKIYLTGYVWPSRTSRSCWMMRLSNLAPSYMSFWRKWASTVRLLDIFSKESMLLCIYLLVCVHTIRWLVYST